MNNKLRKTIIAGNWKMNKTPSEAKLFINDLKTLVKDAKCDVIVGVPFVCLPVVIEAVKGSNIKVAAQNMHFEQSGAYTGEISAEMLVDLGVEYVIIGHSERRQYFNETNVTLNKKVLHALSAGLKPIICVGEILEEREQGITDELVSLQVKVALNNVTKEQLQNIVIAYEPVWAIGTGKTATADQADEVNGIIRRTLESTYDRTAAESVTIQYGGSMNAKNAEELLSKYHVDGGLIGGASLKTQDFAAIINAASK